jgi:hypothetical protein
MKINKLNEAIDNLLNESNIDLNTDSNGTLTVKQTSKEEYHQYSCDIVNPPAKIRLGVRMLGSHNNDVYGPAVLKGKEYIWTHPRSDDTESAYKFKLVNCDKNYDELRLMPVTAKTWKDVSSKNIAWFAFIDLKKEK